MELIVVFILSYIIIGLIFSQYIYRIARGVSFDRIENNKSKDGDSVVLWIIVVLSFLFWPLPLLVALISLFIKHDNT